MAITAYPFDSQSITEAQYGALFGAIALSGVGGGPASNHFKVTATGSTMVLTVSAVGGASFAIVRGHGILNTTDATVTVSAASAGARVDLVVLRMDYSTNSITPQVKTGTSGSSTPPALTWGAGGIYEIPLALVAVGAGVTFISNANLTDVRRFTGTTVGAWATATRPTQTAQPVVGYNTTTGVWEASLDGSTWTNLATAANQLTDFAGNLPISRGGTGQTTALAARSALEIYQQTAAPAHLAGRIWIKA